MEQAARAAGLMRPNQALTQCRVLRDTRMAMGLILTREGSDTGEWVWAMPGTQQQQCRNGAECGEAGSALTSWTAEDPEPLYYFFSAPSPAK